MRNRFMTITVQKLFLFIVAALSPASIVLAQSGSFTYQGRLTDAGTAANATYDMQFKLFDSPTVGAGNQIGSTINNGSVLVNGGVFTVQLDFGTAAFSGADRYLEIGVRLAGDSSAFTLLSPRQQLTSAVYAIRAGSSTNADTATNANTATNATQLGGVAASQYVQTGDSRLSDSRPPTPGSASYIQNSSNQQAANFNISGNGTAGGNLSANTVNATTQFNLSGNRFLSAGGNKNTFAGIDAGTANNSGSYNSFFGEGAGKANTFGDGNSFFGEIAGEKNKSGGNNSFFGRAAGRDNTGYANSFFGALSGSNNETGRDNSFVGYNAGSLNDGDYNTYVGSFAGTYGRTGSLNTFVGYFTGSGDKAGKGLTLIGSEANVPTPPPGSSSLSNATAIGAKAYVAQSNSLVLGSIKGVNNTVEGEAEDTNVGIGTPAPKSRLHIAVNGNSIHLGHAGCASGYVGLGFGASLSDCTNYSLLGDGINTIINRPTGGAIAFRENNVNQMTISAGGAVSIFTLGSAGDTQLCRNASNRISTCSSSLRYKTNIQPFFGGLSVLNRLRPITFDWKQGGKHDLGFGAEDIAAIEPLLVTRNDKGEVEGVKYDRITAVLVNAVKEQQDQIKQQQNQIESLKRLVCQRNRRAAVCK